MGTKVKSHSDYLSKSVKWDQSNKNWKFCTKIENPSERLLSALQYEISTSKSKNQEVIILISLYDAVKNFEPESSDGSYNFFSDEWKSLSYEEKAETMRYLQEKDPRLYSENEKKLNVKHWSIQQWPYNLIKYCELTNKKLIYIQGDHTYCKFPSVFAEAMADTLYKYYIPIDKFSHYFIGDTGSLFCVGDKKVVYGCLNFVENLYPDVKIIDHNGLMEDKYRSLNPDLDWALMSDEYLVDIYNRIIAGEICATKKSYIYYPWSIIYKNIGSVIEETEIKLGGKTLVGRYIGDIFPDTEDNYIFYLLPVDNHENNHENTCPIAFSGKHLPLVFVANTYKNYKYYISMYYMRRLVPYSVYFSGTYTKPVVQVEGEIVDRYVTEKIILKPLSEEINFYEQI